MALFMTIISPLIASAGVELQRPLEEREVPEAIDFSVDGRELRCFDRDGWEQIAHIVIDYRAFFGWADRMELRLKIEEGSHAITRHKLESFEEIARLSKDANQMCLAQIDSYQQAAKSEKTRKVWSLVGHAVGLVAIATLGAVVVARQ